MTEIDFLPDWYHVRQERRRSYFAFIWLGACLLGAMSLWLYLCHSRIKQCRDDLRQLQAERNVVNDQLVRIDKLRAVRDDLARKSDIAGRLQNRPDAIHVLACMIDLVPRDLALVDMELSGRWADPAGGPGRNPRRSAGTASGASDSAQQGGYVLRLVGAAPFDDLVANFITRLANSDAFTDVQISYTREVKKSGRLMRQFELTCELAGRWEAISAEPGKQDGSVRPAQASRRMELASYGEEQSP